MASHIEKIRRGKNKPVAKKKNPPSFIRFKHLHPFPKKQGKAILKKYGGKKLTWVQEEPANMGYWSYISQRISGLELIARKSSASPATGYGKVHKAEQEEIIRKALE